MQDHLKLDGVSVEIENRPVLCGISFGLKTGQIGSLLGPSGCGKTTLLRTIAGFERPSTGTIRLRRQSVTAPGHWLAPEERRVGMVFQDLALFPHLTIAGNVGFGIRHYPAQERTRRVDELLGLVGLHADRNRYPHQLSGGQQQRVALIRAMAARPDILLLDEPFSGQDLERREQLAREIAAILRREGITALLVTHDQMEAFAFADVIGVLHKGILCQWDSAYALYHQPTSRLVADFIGPGVFIRGRVRNDRQLQTGLGTISGAFARQYSPGTEVDLLVRPDDVLHDDASPDTALVVEKLFRGADHLYTLQLPEVPRLLCLAPSHHNHAIGERIGIRLEIDHLVTFPRHQ